MSPPESSRDDSLWINNTGDGGEPLEGSAAGRSRRAREADRRRADPVRRILSSIQPGFEALRAENRELRAELQRVQELAVTDTLTGLANRRGWDVQLNRELSRARRLSHPLCVGLVDIDHFKAFNDSQGHLAADRLLVEIAATWRSRVRDIDLVCRWGGDEFGVLLPDCPLGDADQILVRLQSSLPGEQSATGAAVCWDRQEDAEQILGRADRQLYEAKQSLPHPRDPFPRG